MKATMALLKKFKGKQPCMGNIYIIMRALRHHIMTLRNAPFNISCHLVDPLEVAFRKKEALVYSNLYYVGALLHPYLIHNMELRDDQHEMVGLMRVFHKLFDIDKGFQVVKVKFSLYFHILSPYYGNHIWSPTGVKEVPHVW
jgi:hypothetical protein